MINNISKYFLILAFMMFSVKLFSQEIKMDSLIGKWFLDEGKKPVIIEFKKDSTFWGKDAKLTGLYNLKYIKNENVLTLSINTGAYAGQEDIFVLRKFPYARFYMLQIPKRNKKGAAIIEWQKHYGKDEILLSRINPEDTIKNN
jgi:hypothetical protein